MKPALLLPIAVALLLAGSVVSWWRFPTDTDKGVNIRVSTGLLMMQQCTEGPGDDVCKFTEDTTELATARHWTFLVGLVAAALLIALHAAPTGTRLRRALGAAGVIASATAMVLGLGVLCVLVQVAIEIGRGYPGLGGPIFIGGAILGLRTARGLVVGEPAA